jgi:iron complex transport system substrate-binding protein
MYPGLNVAKQGRDVFLEQDDPLQAALSFSTVLSLPFVIDNLVPRIAAGIDGDPVTTPTK